ncbi:hypothetical protein NIES4071_104110 (plasmid) [Calothrix sp. NIES-4071]|nr:hypothetical protein NIES4071_104110 [Calothrix sp. NIES-4071]BAZ64398.1 hypothetical protein NIES4105_101310 [Calothrix sp. NIES-4105]
MSKRKNSGDDFSAKNLDGYKIQESELLNPKPKKSKIIEFLPLPPLSGSE